MPSNVSERISAGQGAAAISEGLLVTTTGNYWDAWGAKRFTHRVWAMVLTFSIIRFYLVTDERR
ncbi:MAG: hypothetical protein WBI82_06125 [Sphaerochaeta sp.]